MYPIFRLENAFRRGKRISTPENVLCRCQIIAYRYTGEISHRRTGKMEPVNRSECSTADCRPKLVFQQFQWWVVRAALTLFSAIGFIA